MHAPRSTEHKVSTVSSSSGAADSVKPKWNLRDLIAAPKGTLGYDASESWLLHVFWECPSIEAARALLAGLAQCARATQRDTPCVPTYFFRLSSCNADLCLPTSRVVGDIPALREAVKKLAVGVPASAVAKDLAKRGIDPGLVIERADMDAALPAALQTTPVALECTEVYLDERAFMEHAGSRDYLDGYGVVMQPSGFHRVPTTVRVGTPPASIVDGILEPILHEVVAALAPGSVVFTRAPAVEAARVGLFISLDVPSTPMPVLDERLCAACTTCVAFAHPLRAQVARVLCVVAGAVLSPDALRALVALGPIRGEAHVVPESEAMSAAVRAAFAAAGLDGVSVNATDAVGYVLHPRAGEIQPL